MITVVCPVFNEENYIRSVIDFFIEAAPLDKELVIIDGGSTDLTCEIIAEYMQKYSNIRLIANPDKYVPYGLNKAIQSTVGDPVIRLDAHTRYEKDYLTKILETFAKTGADIVGGPMRAIGSTSFQMAVSFATSSSFGVGNSAFHDENYEGYVDSVYLGAWKRSVFADVGLFDTDMLRNQDDEFHYRAKSHSKKIYLNPEIKSWYSPRNNFSSLFKQYYQYGLFKPLVLKKVKSGLKIRHLIPAGFVIYLLTMVIFSGYTISFVPIMVYALLALYFSCKSSTKISVILLMMIVFPTLHIAYGTGFIKGWLIVMMGKKPKI